jgi:hypothetical protein
MGTPGRLLPSFFSFVSFLRRRRRRICFAPSLRGFLPSVHKITIVVTLTLTRSFAVIERVHALFGAG